MHYVYNGKEFKHVHKVYGELEISNSILRVYKPSACTTEVKGMGINEHMVLSYLYAHLDTIEDIPLTYPLKVSKSSLKGKIDIFDNNGVLILHVGIEDVLNVKLICLIMVSLPIKLKVLDSYMADDYQYLLDMDIPQVTDMIYRLIDLNNESTYDCIEYDNDTVDLVDLIESFNRR